MTKRVDAFSILSVSFFYNIMIEIFKNEQFGKIRVAETNEEPMFCLIDLCRALNLRTDGVLPRLKEGGYNQIVVTDSIGREQMTYFVNEMV